ncbi:hypothetical protein ILUMI_01217 [Ignelater luminosus]|uniref:FK506-binding protein 15 n=1 Tax=Ignelater luminosus TaxID=2038154 RepID=A0A8K0DF17_IGNLU|nr:hypothetical protein ILUMI_01217 [Ignelater luminosus]
MFSNNDDDDFFTPSSTSHLASLFGTSMTLQKDSDASLVYTAPKQPRTSGQETPKISPKPATQSSVAFSKVVEVFRLVDSSYVPVGKCGMAIIASENAKAHELILYKTKQDILSRSNLRSDLTFTIQANNYVSFGDDQKIQWTAHFDSAKTLDEFTEQIKVCGGAVIPISIKPTNVCDKDTSAESSIKSEPISSPKNSPVPKKDSDSSDNSSSQARANILSRMAKMGQSILPMNLPKASEQSDSETDEQAVSKKPVKKKQKFVLVNGEYVPSDKLKHINNHTSNIQTPEFLMLNGQIVPVSALQQSLSTQLQNPIPNQYSIPGLPNQVVLNPQVSPMSDSLHVFIAENRTHNCEMRMNVTQLSSKLDNILLKLNQNNRSSSDEITNKNVLELQILEKVKELETSEERISSLQKENTKLQEDLVDNNLVIKSLKQENENQKKLILEQEQKIGELEKYNQCLENQITQNKVLQDNTSQMQQTINDLNQIIEDQKIKQQSEESRENIEEKQNLKSSLATLNEDIVHLRTQLEDKNSKADIFSRKLKQSMNTLFQQIMEDFDDENITFQSIQIKQILSQKLKATTLQIIQDFQNDFKTNNQ